MSASDATLEHVQSNFIHMGPPNQPVSHYGHHASLHISEDTPADPVSLPSLATPIPSNTVDIYIDTQTLLDNCYKFSNYRDCSL